MTSQEALDYFLDNAHPYLKKMKELANSRGVKIIADPEEQFIYMPGGKVMIGWFMSDARPENGGEFNMIAPIRGISYMFANMPPSELVYFLEGQVIALSHEIGHVIDYCEREITDGRKYPGICSFAAARPCLLREIRASFKAKKEVLPKIIDNNELPRYIKLLVDFSREYFSNGLYDFCRRPSLNVNCREVCDKEMEAFLE